MGWKGYPAEFRPDVHYVAVSIATRSLSEGFAPNKLAREVREATAQLGTPPENLIKRVRSGSWSRRDRCRAMRDQRQRASESTRQSPPPGSS